MASELDGQVAEVTLKTLLEVEPLYVWRDLPERVGTDDKPLRCPSQIEFPCPACKKSRPFERVEPDGEPLARQRAAIIGRPGAVQMRQGVNVERFRCIACKLASATFLLEVRGAKPPYRVRKAGQSPEISIAISTELQELLGEDELVFMRRAKTSLANGYGLGACGYLRRILEDRVDALLRLMRALHEFMGRDKKELEKLDRIIAGKNADEKFAKALPLVPESIIVEGSNPLAVLHDFLSKGLHKLSEEECVAAAQNAMTALDFIAVELSRQTRTRKQYSESIRAIDRLRRAPSAAGAKPKTRRERFE